MAETSPDASIPGLVPDFGRVADDYAKWRQGFPTEFFARLEALGVGRRGQFLLDLGTGTGLLGRGFALRGCTVTGLDPSPDLIARARQADREAGVATTYIQASAEATGLPNESFDVVTAGTCWHWFDRPKAALEARRVLRPDGRLLIAALDWHIARGNVGYVTWRLIERFSPVKSSEWLTFEYPKWTSDLIRAGFHSWEAFAFTMVLPYSLDAWRGRVRASARVGPVMDADTLARFDAALEMALAERFPGDTLAVDHRVFALVAWTKPAMKAADEHV